MVYNPLSARLTHAQSGPGLTIVLQRPVNVCGSTVRRRQSQFTEPLGVLGRTLASGLAPAKSMDAQGAIAKAQQHAFRRLPEMSRRA